MDILRGSTIAVLLAFPLCLGSVGSSGTKQSMAQGAIVFGTLLDSASSLPIHPSRVELLGSAVFTFGDTLGRFVLSPVPKGEHTLRVRGIGFFAKDVSISVHSDTLRLTAILLSRNPRLDSLNLIAPS